MQVHRPLAERRRQLIDAGLAIAEREGPDAVTVRRVAAEAGVSLGLMYHCFSTKDQLTVAMATRIAQDLAEAGDVARGDVHGPAATHDVGTVLRAALDGLWAEVERTPGRQLLTYEITTRALREPGLGDVAQRQYDATVAMAVAVLERAAGTAGVTWARDVQYLAGLVVMAIDGATLRWLVDQDSPAALARLRDVAALLTTMTV
jgi:AcrR family transcriptional regulator